MLGSVLAQGEDGHEKRNQKAALEEVVGDIKCFEVQLWECVEEKVFHAAVGGRVLANFDIGDAGMIRWAKVMVQCGIHWKNMSVDFVWREGNSRRKKMAAQAPGNPKGMGWVMQGHPLSWPRSVSVCWEKAVMMLFPSLAISTVKVAKESPDHHDVQENERGRGCEQWGLGMGYNPAKKGKDVEE